MSPFSPAVGIQQFATLNLTLTLTLTVILILTMTLTLTLTQTLTLILTVTVTVTNTTVITDPQIGRRDPQIVTVQIRPAPHFVVCLGDSSVRRITRTDADEIRRDV